MNELYLFDHSSAWAWEIDASDRYTYCSENVAVILGFDAAEVIGKTPFYFMPPNEAERIEPIFREIASRADPIIGLENWVLDRNRNPVCLATTGFPVFDQSGRLIGYRGVDQNITRLKHLEGELKKKAEEIHNLKTTLRTILQEGSNVKRKVEKTIMINIKRLIFPHLEALQSSHLGKRQRALTETIHINLKQITSGFVQELSQSFASLTPTEIKIADLIRDGKTTKEIAATTGISPNAIKFHRYNIRKKLHLRNRKINLRTFLLSYPKE